MQYTAVILDYSQADEWERDLAEQALADIGFEAFDGGVAYVQTSIYDEQKLRTTLAFHPSVRLVRAETCPDENWNATWEEEHPVFVVQAGDKEVSICPRCAFGAGYHETTSMLIEALNRTVLTGKTVLDNGCGTGVLGIVAKVLGAKRVVCVDIDENSVANCRENAEQNACADDDFIVLQGSTPPTGKYDLILSNIHRNILLEQMATYAQCLLPDGEVWMSGFYRDDVETLQAALVAQGLQVKEICSRGEWQMIRGQKPRCSQG